MISGNNSLQDNGLIFFGKINASISHEIRNVLAVINENAGLIKDLLQMAEKGVSLDPDRVTKGVENILAQVKRGDMIVGNMNRFAHSVDKPHASIDLGEYVELITRIMNRFAAMKGASLQYNPVSESIEILTFPLDLENMLHLCMDYAIDIAGDEKEISITTTKKENRLQIHIGGLKIYGENQHNSDNFITENNMLLQRLDARIIEDANTGTLILDLPYKIEVQ
jgi:C4-dicarboxylate-specific signal transduction histidine kinase